MKTTLNSMKTNPDGKTVNSLALLGDLSRLRWVIPSYRVNLCEKVNVRRANRYLLIQGIIISNMIGKGQYKLAVSKFL